MDTSVLVMILKLTFHIFIINMGYILDNAANQYFFKNPIQGIRIIPISHLYHHQRLIIKGCWGYYYFNLSNQHKITKGTAKRSLSWVQPILISFLSRQCQVQQTHISEPVVLAYIDCISDHKDHSGDTNVKMSFCLDFNEKQSLEVRESKEGPNIS